MTSRLGSALTSCSSKSRSETVEIITADDEVSGSEDDSSKVNEILSKENPDQPQSSFFWRVSSGAIGGVYNAASGAVGMGYNTTKWALGKGAELGSGVIGASGTVLSKSAELGSGIVAKLPVPSKLKSKDKKE